MPPVLWPSMSCIAVLAMPIISIRHTRRFKYSTLETVMCLNVASKTRVLLNLACALLVLLCVSMAGCAHRPLDPIDPKLYASGTAYAYQPLNPTSVWIRDPEKEEQKGNP